MISVKLLVVFSALAVIASCRRILGPFSRNIALTIDGRKCITDCNNWCRPNFNEWVECTETDALAPDYYTAMKQTTKPRCESDCIKDGVNYKCLTDVKTKEWDYCSPYAGVSVSENKCKGACRQQGKSYSCETKSKHEFCSPAPEEHVKDNIKAGKRCLRPKLTKATLKLHRRGHDYFLRSGAGRIDFEHYYDINELVRRSERNNTVGTSNEPNRPRVTYTTSRHNGVDVLHSMRARLNRNNLPETGFPRGAHPRGTDARMTQLNRQQGIDDVGHVMAIGLGGPNILVNILPQHAITNRNLGRDDTSYSYWRMTEAFIRWLARHPDTSYVDLNIYVFYEGNLNDLVNRRPVGFGFRYIAHFTNGDVMDSSDCTFQNDYINQYLAEE